jgi:hypothetical protein
MSVHILDSIDRTSKVIFYPSSCNYHDKFQDTPYDVVILNSRSIRQQRRINKVYCLNYDNNELLGLFLAKGITISSLIIIRDGCKEGGNYECIAKDGFFGRLMPVMAEKLDYFCDHASFSIDVPARFEEFQRPAYLEPFIRFSYPLQDVKAFHVTTRIDEKSFMLGRIRLKIIQDSIWRGLNQSDLTVVKITGSSQWAIRYYLKGLMPDEDLSKRFEFVTEPRMTSIEHLLKRADANKLRRLSFMPMGGRYRRIINEIESWGGDYPQEISFYHLNANDFQQLKSLQHR